MVKEDRLNNYVEAYERAKEDFVNGPLKDSSRG